VVATQQLTKIRRGVTVEVTSINYQPLLWVVMYNMTIVKH